MTHVEIRARPLRTRAHRRLDASGLAFEAIDVHGDAVAEIAVASAARRSVAVERSVRA